MLTWLLMMKGFPPGYLAFATHGMPWICTKERSIYVWIFCKFSAGLVRDRRQQSRTFRRCLVGAEMVDWLLAIGSANGQVKSRHQATGMWQALLEESIIQHGKYFYYFTRRLLLSQSTG